MSCHARWGVKESMVSLPVCCKHSRAVPEGLAAPVQTYDQIYTTNYPRWGGTTARNYTSPLLHTVTLTDLAPATTCAPSHCVYTPHHILPIPCRAAHTLRQHLGCRSSCACLLCSAS